MLIDDVDDIYNVGLDEPVVMMQDLARMISGLAGNVPIIIENRKNLNARETNRYVPDITRLKKLYNPLVGLEESLWRTMTSLHLRGIIPNFPKEYT
ncbi:MAG TPA: hypothetical protein VND43_06525 [Burkholderiales bacterium]|nr:hypothetical protein [Burkholderiales bacterium]